MARSDLPFAVFALSSLLTVLCACFVALFLMWTGIDPLLACFAGGVFHAAHKPMSDNILMGFGINRPRDFWRISAGLALSALPTGAFISGVALGADVIASSFWMTVPAILVCGVLCRRWADMTFIEPCRLTLEEADA